MCANRWCETAPAGRRSARLVGQFGAARMSGSGACVFIEMDSLEQAEIVKSQIPEPWAGYVATATNFSPLHQQLGLLD